MAELTYTNPLKFDIFPIPGSILKFDIKIKGTKIKLKINVDVNIFYKDPYVIGRVFLINSGIQNIFTETEDKWHFLKFKIPDFQNRTQSYINITMEPVGDPYQKVIIDGTRIEMESQFTNPSAALAIPHIQPKIRSPISSIPASGWSLPSKNPIIDSKITPSTIKGPEITDNTDKIAIASIIRDEESRGTLGRFLECCTDLEKLYDNIIYIFLEGDSKDNTYTVLKDWVEKRNGSILEKIDRGQMQFPHDRDPRRTRYFAELRNRLLDIAVSIPFVSDVLMVDGNYGWKGDLIASLRIINTDIVAPLALYKHGENKLFYDIWAFRKNGKEFSPHFPYIEGNDGEHFLELDSVGACYLIRRHVIESGVRYDGNNDSEQAGFSRNAKNKGFKIAINPKASVIKGGFKE